VLISYRGCFGHSDLCLCQWCQLYAVLIFAQRCKLWTEWTIWAESHQQTELNCCCFDWDTVARLVHWLMLVFRWDQSSVCGSIFGLSPNMRSTNFTDAKNSILVSAYCFICLKALNVCENCNVIRHSIGMYNIGIITDAIAIFIFVYVWM